MGHNSLSIAACAALAVLSTAALAQRAVEPSTGLAVEPPPGLVARPLPLRAPRLAAFSVRRADETTDTGCEVSVIPAPGNASYSQAELNRVAAGEQYRTLTTQAFAAGYEVHRAERFSQAGLEGIMIDATMRMAQGVPASMANSRSLIFRLETPRYRISTSCTADREQFERRRAEFIAVARGVSIAKPSGG